MGFFEEENYTIMPTLHLGYAQTELVLHTTIQQALRKKHTLAASVCHELDRLDETHDLS